MRISIITYCYHHILGQTEHNSGERYAFAGLALIAGFRIFWGSMISVRSILLLVFGGLSLAGAIAVP